MRDMYMQLDDMWKFHATTFNNKEVNINFK